MTAPFAASLCGFRSTGLPSTSDSNDQGSIEWGRALFDELGVPPGATEVHQIGAAMESAARTEMAKIRPDLEFGSGAAIAFEQYAHLRVFREFSKAYKGPGDSLDAEIADLDAANPSRELRAFLIKVQRIEKQAALDHALIESLRANMPDESLLNLDLTVARKSTGNVPARLLAGFSSKWSLRTDRAQDCISQGSKLVSLRRGRMPHYAVITMEPRPAMLKLLAYGSGSVDCVYHLALPELRAAGQLIESTKSGGVWRPRTELERMVSQGRLRDWDDLAAEIAGL